MFTQSLDNKFSKFFVSHNFFIASNRPFPPDFKYVNGFFLSSLV